MWLRLVCWCAGGWCAAVGLFAQDRSFRTETRVVQVPVSVTDGKGANVDGLRARDFLLLDDGAPRAPALDTFGTGMAPISLVIAVQTSGISKPALAKVRRIGSMIQPLIIGRRGEAAVVTFDDEISWLLDFTSNADAIQKALKSLDFGTSTQARMQARMLDTVVDAADLMKDRKGRRVLLLISETKDRGSHARLDQALQAVEREGVEVFAATYSAAGTAWAANPEDLPPPSGANYMTAFTELFRLGKTNHTLALTQATGGSDYAFLRERGIEKAIETLGVDVHSQYILSFAGDHAASGMHRIDVSLPNRSDVRIRARRAWWAD
jgi:VWFA-related protein